MGYQTNDSPHGDDAAPLDTRSLFTHADIVHRYTRAQALVDGTLLDLTVEGKEAGIRYPVAITAAAYATAIEMTDAAHRMGCDEPGRRWDVVWMLRCAMAQAPPNVDTLTVRLLVVQDKDQPELVELRAVCGPGDDAEPVVTIMRPGED